MKTTFLLCAFFLPLIGCSSGGNQSTQTTDVPTPAAANNFAKSDLFETAVIGLWTNTSVDLTSKSLTVRARLTSDGAGVESEILALSGEDRLLLKSGSSIHLFEIALEEDAVFDDGVGIYETTIPLPNPDEVLMPL